MPKKAEHVNPEVDCQLSVRVPGWFKNELVDHVKQVGVPLSVWVVNCLREGLREGKGFPAAPPAVRGLPGLDEQVRLWVLGERLVMPCGRVGECAGLGGVVLPGGSFCGECGVRVG